MKYGSALILVAGIGCLGLFELLGSTITADGRLQEPFFLLPVGWGLIALAAVCPTICLARRRTVR